MKELDGTKSWIIYMDYQLFFVMSTWKLSRIALRRTPGAIHHCAKKLKKKKKRR